MKPRRDPLDILFSEFIRRRAISEAGGCERCLTPKYDQQKENGDIFDAWKLLDCSHYHGRSSKSVRWDPDNAAGLCGACHIHLGGHPEEHKQFFLDRLREQGLDLLAGRLRTQARYIDKAGITLWLKEEIRKLKNERAR